MIKSILYVHVFLVLFTTSLYGNEYRSIDTVSLQKDQFKKVLVKYDNVVKVFKFRWTLYVNKGLVLLRSYDRVVAQNILYLRHKNKSFRLELTPRGTNSIKVPYLLVQFVAFDYEKNMATFKMYLSDDKGIVSLEDIKEE